MIIDSLSTENLIILRLQAHPMDLTTNILRKINCHDSYASTHSFLLQPSSTLAYKEVILFLKVNVVPVLMNYNQSFVANENYTSRNQFTENLMLLKQPNEIF